MVDKDGKEINNQKARRTLYVRYAKDCSVPPSEADTTPDVDNGTNTPTGDGTDKVEK